MNILLVENVPESRARTARVLNAAGYKVFEASAPDEADRIVRDHLVHLIIADVRLVDDQDENDESGLAFCRRVDPSIPRIIVTGFPDWELVRATLNPLDTHEPVANAFFEKGESTDVLLGEIQRVVRAEYDVIPSRRIAVITSGGDAPGMNASIYGILRAATAAQTEVFGVFDGYEGLVHGRLKKLRWRSFEGSMLVGGTVLGTARMPSFAQADVRRRAADELIRRHITALVVIGGDGSMRGASALARDIESDLGHHIQVIALPGTIDNDLYGTNMSIGAASGATAVMKELQSMIAPAQALRRIFVCEVMGRYSGYLALQAGLCVGADAILLPEELIALETKWERHPDWRDHVRINDTEQRVFDCVKGVAAELRTSFGNGKRHAFVLVSEALRLLTTKDGSTRVSIEKVQAILRDEIDTWEDVRPRPDVRTQIIGYPTRGPAPSRFDIQLGIRLGAEAVKAIAAGETNVMIGWSGGGTIRKTSFEDVVMKTAYAPTARWKDRPDWRALVELHRALVRPPQAVL